MACRADHGRGLFQGYGMSLQKRLSAIEGRLRKLEEWKGHVEELVDEEESPQPERTLDGDEAYGERDQDQPL